VAGIPGEPSFPGFPSYSSIPSQGRETLLGVREPQIVLGYPGRTLGFTGDSGEPHLYGIKPAHKLSARRDNLHTNISLFM
jgi:hypothetical protein